MKFTDTQTRLIPLLAASFLAITLLLPRILYASQLVHAHMLWNLFLAWLPVILAAFAWRHRHHRLRLGAFGPLWLLFLPNAPYLITDLIHLRPITPVPLWYDALLLFTFAFTGLVLGLSSLYQMQTLVSQRFGAAASCLFACVVCGLSGLGVYIGRFLRWNSWDTFTQPARLFNDISQSFLTPNLQLKALLIVLLFSAITGIAYSFFALHYSLPTLIPSGQNAVNE